MKMPAAIILPAKNQGLPLATHGGKGVQADGHLLIKGVLAAVLFLGFSTGCFCSGAGTGSADFLKIPVGARETALGGAFTAAADNADSVYYNPAGLGLLQGPEISFTHNNYIEGVSQQWLAAACPYRSGAFGFGLNYLSVPAFAAYDAFDNRTGSVSGSGAALYLSWGGRLAKDGFFSSVSYGTSAKYISEKLDTEKGTGYGLDLGLLAATAADDLRFGFSVENAAASRLKFIEEGARPALAYKAGVLYEIRSSARKVVTRQTLDYVQSGDRPGYLAAGIEHVFNGALSVRVGYSAAGDISNGFSFGLGFNLLDHAGRGFGVDYSFGATDAFGNIHKLSLTYKFGALAVSNGFRGAHTGPTLGRRPVYRSSSRESSVAYCLDILNNGSLSQRRSVVAELGAKDKDDEDSFNLLLALLKDDQPLIVMDAVSALADYNSLRVIEPFIELLKIQNVNIRVAAISGLARYKDAAVLKALEDCLSDRAPKVRSRAAEVLGNWADVRAARLLVAAQEHEKESLVKHAIMNALKKLDAAVPGAGQ